MPTQKAESLARERLSSVGMSEFDPRNMLTHKVAWQVSIASVA